MKVPRDKRRRMFKIRQINGEWAVSKLTYSHSVLYAEGYIWLANFPSMKNAMEWIYNVWLVDELHIPQHRSA